MRLMNASSFGTGIGTGLQGDEATTEGGIGELLQGQNFCIKWT